MSLLRSANSPTHLQLEHDLAQQDDGDDAGLAPDNADPATNEFEPAPDGVGVDLGMDAGDAMDEGEDEENWPLGNAGNMSVSEDGPHTTPPAPPPRHGLRHNPTAMVEEWPDPDGSSVGSDLGDAEPIDGAERDPEFVERVEPLGFHPDDEPEMDDEVVRAFLDLNLGDLAEDEWIDMYDRFISDKDHEALKFLATRLRTHFSRQTYGDLRHG
ncbi:hypothetical protein FRC10_004331, partial [Ceratobasidium sp. 414]